MAISFKSDKDYAYGLLPLFGVGAELIQHAKVLGITVDQSSPGMFVIKFKDHLYGSVPVKGSAISLAKSKTLGPASKEALKFQFESALKKAIAASGSDPADTMGYDYASPKPVQAPPTNVGIPWPTAVSKTPLTGMTIPVASKPKESKFSKTSPVALADADHVYQAVTGTTGGSVYFVLAMFDGMNLAARVSGSKLSVRAEGPKLKNYTPAFNDFEIDAKGNYSSGHYDVHSTGLMIKSLSALIGRVGFSKAKSIADIETFIGGQA